MGLLLSVMARPGDIPWFYCYSLGRFEYQRWLFQVRSSETFNVKDEARRITDTDSAQIVTLESADIPTGEPCPDRGSFTENPPSLLKTESRCQYNQQLELWNGIEDSVKEGIQAQRKENGKMGHVGASNDDVDSDCNEACFFKNAGYFHFSPEHGNFASPDEKRHGNAITHCCRRRSALSPVKEELDSNTFSKQPSRYDPRLDETFPVFEDSEAVPRISLSKRGERGAHSRAPHYQHPRAYCSLSSDSGIGDALRGSWSTTSSSSVCRSTSESSDCNSSTHSDDMSSAGHSDDNEGCEAAATDVFGHNSCGGEDSRDEVLYDVKDGVNGRQDDVNPLSWSKSQNHPQKQVTADKRHVRPISAPLNFRARRKVTFSEDCDTDEGRQDVSSGRSHHDSFSSLPSPTSESSSSSFLKRFRPVFSQQDSDDSSSSLSSGDSILAVPLSTDSPGSCHSPPVSPTPSTCHSPTFVFPDEHTGTHSFSESREGCDLVLLAQGQRFHVHSAVVVWQCSVLREHLGQTGASEVLLLDKTAADVLCLLHLLYPFQRQAITESNVWSMVDLALYLGCERVLRMCTTFLTGLAHLPHLCPHRQLTPSPSYRHTVSRSASLHSVDTSEACPPTSLSTHRFHADKRTVTASCLCACAETMVERVLDILMLAASHDLEGVYHTFLDVAAKVKASDLTSCPRFKHLPAVIRQDILTSRLTRLEHVVSNLGLQESNLVNCGHQRHDTARVTFRGPLCLKCSSRSLLHEAYSLG